MDSNTNFQQQPIHHQHPLTDSTDSGQFKQQPVSYNPPPPHRLPDDAALPHTGWGGKSEAASDPFLSGLEEGPFTIRQQAESIHHPGESTAARIQVIYRASRYLNRWHPGSYGWNEWTENLRAARILCRGFELHPHEAFQLLRFDFNPRCHNPLSDQDLWKVILTASGLLHKKGRGWLNTPGRQSRPLRPRPPEWMREREESFFWIWEPERNERWIEEMTRRVPLDLSAFANGLLSICCQRGNGTTISEPPLQDYPLLTSEISDALRLTCREVEKRLGDLLEYRLVVPMDLHHVPGIWMAVLVPNTSD